MRFITFKPSDDSVVGADPPEERHTRVRGVGYAVVGGLLLLLGVKAFKRSPAVAGDPRDLQRAIKDLEAIEADKKEAERIDKYMAEQGKSLNERAYMRALLAHRR